MFFGTSTTTGLKVGFTANVPDSFVFGYKRKEFSFIPLGSATEGGVRVDRYPSVLASIDTAASAGTSGTGDQARGTAVLGNTQFFATGTAAEGLARSKEVRDLFAAEVARAFSARVAPASSELQPRREKAADIIKNLPDNDQLELARSLGNRTDSIEHALGDNLFSVSKANTKDSFDFIAQKLKILFGEDV